MQRSRIGLACLPAVFLMLAFRCDPPPPVCPAIYAPACGVDGHTYGNDCEARAAGVAIAHEGECEVLCVADSDCGPLQACSFERCLGACPMDGPCPPVVCEGTCIDVPVCGAAVCAPGWHCEVLDCAPVPSGYPPVDCSAATCVPDAGSCRTDADCAPSEHCEIVELMSDPAVMRTGTCEPNYGCPPIDCAAIYCPFGMAHDAAGCTLCECAPPPSDCSSDADCPAGGLCQPIGCMCPPDADCLIACPGTCVWPVD